MPLINFNSDYRHTEAIFFLYYCTPLAYTKETTNQPIS